MHIGFIGFGEAARAFQESLSGTNGDLSFSATDILLDHEGADGDCARAMREPGLGTLVPGAPDAGARRCGGCRHRWHA